MPRTYIAKGSKKYSDADLEIAIRKVTEGMTIIKASKDYSVPYETLRRWVTKPPSVKGSRGQTALSVDEERLIVEALKFTARCGYPLGRKDVLDMVQSYMNSHPERNTPFKDNRPGPDWARNFEKRWEKEIGKRKPEILTKSRAECLSQHVVDTFFCTYEKVLDEKNFRDHPERIFNLDEVGLSTDPRNAKVFVQKSARTAYLKTPNCGKAMYSVLFCISASGSYLPPFVIYKSMNLYSTWTKNGPEGAAYGCTKSGWMEDTVFESWFKIFTKHVENLQKPILLLFDGHASHLTYATVKHAIDNEIIIICLPPNTSHALQPLDVGVFGPLKLKWKDILKDWLRETRLQAVDKAVFPHLLRKLFGNISQKNAVKGFKGSGLFPPNKKAIQHRIVSTKSSDCSQILASAAENHNLSSSEVMNNSSDVLQVLPSTSLDMPVSISSSPLGPDKMQSPYKDLKRAIINVISPKPSTSTLNALTNSKARRKRVQAKIGEVLTSEEVAARLQAEEEQRKAKKCKNNSKKTKESENNQPTQTSIPLNLSSREVVFSTGDWVLVEYLAKKSKKYFIAQVIESSNYVQIVKFLKKSQMGDFFSFPNDEEVEIEKEQVIKKLNQPTLNNRGHYIFNCNEIVDYVVQ